MISTGTGLVLSALRKASTLAPRVTHQVVAFGNPSKLAGALLEAAVADLSNTGTRETFEQGAPAVVQRLAELGKAKPTFSCSVLRRSRSATSCSGSGSG